MKKIAFVWFKYVTLALLLLSTACATAAPVATATSTPVPPTATATTRPTSTPRPTATPNLAATKESEADQATIQGYLESGYVSTTQGTFYKLTDSTREMAKKNFLDYDVTGYKDTVTDFAASADLKWISASPVRFPEFSGYGFGFRMKDNGDSYTVMLTNESVLVTWCFQALKGCGRVGKSNGKGTVKFGNPAEAHFEFIVTKGHAYALVDGGLIASYTLFEDRLTDPGYFLYTIVSGTNKEYGTRCSVTNGKLWVPAE